MPCLYLQQERLYAIFLPLLSVHSLHHGLRDWCYLYYEHANCKRNVILGYITYHTKLSIWKYHSHIRQNCKSGCGWILVRIYSDLKGSFFWICDTFKSEIVIAIFLWKSRGDFHAKHYVAVCKRIASIFGFLIHYYINIIYTKNQIKI